MAEINQVERISQVIDSLDDGGTYSFMGVLIEEFDRDHLLKLIRIGLRVGQWPLEQQLVKTPTGG